MFAVEPPPTQGDLHFRVFGFPVRVSPWFWAVAVMLTVGGGREVAPVEALTWVVVMFVSILVHELGHAFTQRHFGGRPRIVLYGLGGLAISDDTDLSPRSQILISLAGPGAGFLLAAIVVSIIAAAGHFRGFEFSLVPIDYTFFDPVTVSENGTAILSLRDNAIWDLLSINIVWGLVNLLPIYPLDGGRVSRELFTLNHSRRGIIQSLWLSAVVAAAFAIFGLTRGSIFTAIMFGYLAYANYQNIQAYDRHWQ